jgi:hypothetical protein
MAASSEATDTATVARGYFEAVGRRDLDAMTAFYEPGGTGEIHGLIELQVPDTYRAGSGRCSKPSRISASRSST